ncbi:hypothetical protein N3K66_008887 [Trichothecium roseum]|uniref:Uncharacterized protein n=1 Tax=Trichothecium roseum TaxID=47278 RepID=A0ACC0USL3_9HYPO|nr:hypothetical protein N3K66_008887 [Trichothecium roseum]
MSGLPTVMIPNDTRPLTTLTTLPPPPPPPPSSSSACPHPRDVVARARSEFRRIGAAMAAHSASAHAENIPDVPADFTDEAAAVCEEAKQAVADLVRRKRAAILTTTTTTPSASPEGGSGLGIWFWARWQALRLARLRARGDAWLSRLDDGLAGLKEQRSYLMHRQL